MFNLKLYAGRKEPIVRIELKCGQNETCGEIELMHQRAIEIARTHGGRGYSEEAPQGEDTFRDGYVYLPASKVLGVLAIFDTDNEINYDNVDLPPELTGSPLHKALMKLHGQSCGVSINLDQITG
jgi:hypothetical protein